MSEVATIRLTIQNGRDLAIKDTLSSDPYVKYGMVDESGAWLDKKAKTKVQKNTIQPVWMESHDFQLNPKATGFMIECFDYDVIGSNDHMGYGIIDLKNMRLTELPLEHLVVLKPKNKSDFVKGSITVYYTYTTPSFLEQQAQLARQAAEMEADLIVEAPNYELDIETVKGAAAAFSRAVRAGVITTPQELEDFMDRMHMKDQIYVVLQIERPISVNDETFEEVLQSDEEFAIERREAMFRIFDANNDGQITWQEVLQTLALLADTSDIKRKAELQFEIWDINSDGSLTHSEIQKSMNHTFNIFANMIATQVPKKVVNYRARTRRRRQHSMVEWTQEDKVKFIAATKQAMADANIGNQFADAIVGVLGKTKEDRIAKEEFVRFMLEKSQVFFDIRMAMNLKVSELIGVLMNQRHVEKQQQFLASPMGKMTMGVANVAMSRMMPMANHLAPQTAYSKGVPMTSPMMHQQNQAMAMQMQSPLMASLPVNPLQMRMMQAQQMPPGVVPMRGGMSPMAAAMF